MKTRVVGALFVAGIVLLSACTNAAESERVTNSPLSSSPTISVTPTDAVSPAPISITPIEIPQTNALEKSPGFIGTRRLADAYNAPLTLVGVRTPSALTSPVSEWVDAQAEAFTIDISQLPDPSSASLTMQPSQCGAAGAVFCYSIASAANFPLPGTEGNASDTTGQNTTEVDENTTVANSTATASSSPSTHADSSETSGISPTSFDTQTTFKAWMTDVSQGTVVDTVDLLSSQGKKELYTALAGFLDDDVSAEPVAPDFLDAVFLNADGSLTLAITRGVFTPAETDPFTFKIQENLAGTLTGYLTPEGAALRNIIISHAAPIEIPQSPVDCSTLSCVALTFDDGPGEYTAQLLDILADKKVKATFFVIGRSAANNPDLIAREVNEGHVVGNHTWSHPRLSTLNPETIAAELEQTKQAIVAAGAPSPILVRPPYGAQNSTVRQVLAGRGEILSLWSIDTLDWKNRNAAVNTRQAVDRTQAGSIILMHDIHPETVQAIPAIIDELEDKGFVLVTVPELLGEGYEQYAGMTVYSQQRVF